MTEGKKILFYGKFIFLSFIFCLKSKEKILISTAKCPIFSNDFGTKQNPTFTIYKISECNGLLVFEMTVVRKNSLVVGRENTFSHLL